MTGTETEADARGSSVEEAGVPSALDEISFYLGRAYYNYVGVLRRILADVGLDEHVVPGMGNALFVLFERETCIIRDIAERTRLSLSTLTGILRQMERKGLIKRQRDKNDGRAVRVRLTPLGDSLRARCFEVTARLKAVLESGLSEEEVRLFKRMMAGMIESMKQAEKEERSGLPKGERR